MVMPTYSILEKLSLDRKRVEQVGAGFNKDLLTGLLRGKYGFRRMVLSDWSITNDCDSLCEAGMPALLGNFGLGMTRSSRAEREGSAGGQAAG